METAAVGTWDCGKESCNISSAWDPTDFQLQPELKVASEQLVDCLLKRGKKLANDQGTSLRGFSLMDGRLHLSLQQSDYYSSLLHQYGQYQDDEELGETARRLISKYLEASRDLRSSPFPNRMGVTVAVITADSKTLLVRRSAKMAVSAGSYAPAVSGGIRPTRGDCDGDLPIPVKAIIRQAKEELGLDVDLGGREKLTFTRLGQDETKFFQPQLVGVLESGLTTAEIHDLARQAEDKWEATEHLAIDCVYSAIAAFVNSHEMVPVSRLAMVELANYIT